MKKYFKRYLYGMGLFAMVTVVGCKKDFGDINTDPAVVVTPDIKYLLTYSEDKIVTYQGGEWVWEGMEQLLRYSQHVTSQSYEVTSNVNARYGNFFLQIIPNLFEIRKQIAAKSDKDNFQKMGSVTYILQVLQGIKVTDMNGSIPYTEAIKGRYDGVYNPVYDNQQTLFTTWLTELDNAIGVLANSALTNQETYGASDIYYNGDWIKWIMLANTLKLRIALRLENQDKAKTQTIFQQVMADPVGPISNNNAQVRYLSTTYTPFGNDINYRSPRYGTTSIINFLKSVNDPRLGIYFSKNDLVGSFKDTLSKYNATLPSFININDPLIMYQGGPADWTINPAVTSYFSNFYTIAGSPTKYFLMSYINRLFFAPKWNGALGNFEAAEVTCAETCFYIAEFITKGYAGTVNTKGTANDWYTRGITFSIQTMNEIAVNALSGSAYTSDVQGQALITAYLNDPKVKLGAGNDLERIYIQQYLNFYRLPNEAYVFVRRTGYPKSSSTYYARETFNETIPRRWWTTDPGEINRANWTSALTAEGFTPNAQDIPSLSTQRVWYDKTAPDFGKGN
jgi:hypothetical protein